MKCYLIEVSVTSSSDFERCSIHFCRDKVSRSTLYSSPENAIIQQDIARPHNAGIIQTIPDTENFRLILQIFHQ